MPSFNARATGSTLAETITVPAAPRDDGDDVLAQLGLDGVSPATAAAHPSGALQSVATQNAASALAAHPPAIMRSQSLQPCPDCAELVSMRAVLCPKCGCPIRTRYVPPLKPRYRFLRMLASGYQLAGVLFLLVGLLALVLGIAAATGDQSGSAFSFVIAVVGCLVAAATCIMTAEAIYVALDIEENTRASRQMLENSP